MNKLELDDPPHMYSNAKSNFKALMVNNKSRKVNNLPNSGAFKLSFRGKYFGPFCKRRLENTERKCLRQNYLTFFIIWLITLLALHERVMVLPSWTGMLTLLVTEWYALGWHQIWDLTVLLVSWPRTKILHLPSKGSDPSSPLLDWKWV